MKRPSYARLAILVAAFALFASLAYSTFTAGAASRWDAAGLAWAHAVAVPWLTSIMLAASYSGGPSATAIYTFLIECYLLWTRRYRPALAVAIVVYGGILLNIAVKHAFERGRPLIEDPLLTLTTYSFPSGHAAASTIFAGMLCVIGRWSRRGEAAPGAAMNRLVTLVAVVWVGIVGASRVYLGLHYVTDVLAGFLEGVAWLTLTTWLLERHLNVAGRPS